LLRPTLVARAREAVPADRLPMLPNRATTMVAGLVLVRQQPGSAKGVVFMTLEDETGVVNLVIWPSLVARFRSVILGGRLIVAQGQLQRQGAVTHVVARHLADASLLLEQLTAATGGGGLPSLLARADEVRKPPRNPGAPPARRSLFPSRDFQ